MIIWLSERLRKEDKGFTLIELMVVVLIIAILIAIAIPTFLGARRRAQDRQAQSNLRNGLTSEKTYYADAQDYTAVTADLSAIESNLAWGIDDAKARGVVVQKVDAGGQAVALRSFSASGTQFCILDQAQDMAADFEGNATRTAGTYYSRESGTTVVNTTPCDGPWVATTDGWSA